MCNVTGEYKLRKAIFLLCEIFTVWTFCMMFGTGDPMKLLMCCVTVLLICSPGIMERLLSCRISTPVYIFFLLYAIGPMLGYCHNLYYLTNWWDKLLHTCGGVAFALFGAYLFERFSGQQKYILCAVFAFCFSVTLSVLWEFFEFAADTFLGTDMQNDTVITSLNSYYLSKGLGKVGTVSGIEQVIVDGIALPVAGYLDIGLIDSMVDMLLETMGALAVAVITVAAKGKNPVIGPIEKTVGSKQKGRIT